jgi:hypothetical protein
MAAGPALFDSVACASEKGTLEENVCIGTADAVPGVEMVCIVDCALFAELFVDGEFLLPIVFEFVLGFCVLDDVVDCIIAAFGVCVPRVGAGVAKYIRLV